ncbi:MAG TPA: type 1 glutamine amidotransferase [Candidatus Nitrosocosmicus sp.]|nr:type 1 glutamine amidotransferase [Candidatus Nitrosocosmicus sp.]
MAHTNQILCIRNIDIETLGSFENYLLDDGYKITDIMANKTTIESLILKQYDAVFILGGPMSVNDNYDYLVEEKKLIRSAIEYEIPLIGVCLGSQLIASACGGLVYKGSKKEIGWGKVDITDCGTKSVFRNLPRRKIHVFHWHGDSFTLPVGAEVLARSDLYVQAFSFKTAIGIQFHLEVDEEMVKNWSNNYQQELVSENLSKESFLFNQDKNFIELKGISKQVYDAFKVYIEK